MNAFAAIPIRGCGEPPAGGFATRIRNFETHRHEQCGQMSSSVEFVLCEGKGKRIGRFGSTGEWKLNESRGQRRNGVYRSALMCLALSGGASGHAPHEKEEETQRSCG